MIAAVTLALGACVVGNPESVEGLGAPAIQAKCTLACDNPDPPRCLDDGRTLRSLSGGGCVSGSCRYEQSDVECRWGCSEGRCLEEFCAQVVCDSPPPAECADANTLRRFDADGWCEAGRCHYAPSEAACEHGCEAGECTDNRCAAVVCDDPPVAYCVDIRTLRTFGKGSCEAGECSYASTDQTCEHGCDPTTGACNDDCRLWDIKAQQWCGAGAYNCDCTGGCGVQDSCPPSDDDPDCQTWDFDRDEPCPAGIFNCDCAGGCGSASCD
jgi:hypothetical protein